MEEFMTHVLLGAFFIHLRQTELRFIHITNPILSLNCPFHMTFIDFISISFSFSTNSASEKESLLGDTSPTESKTKSDQIPEKDDTKLKDDGTVRTVNRTIANSATATNPQTTDIKYISGDLNSDDLYALPNKRKVDDACGGGDNEKIYEIYSEEEDDNDDENEEKGKSDSIDGIEDKDANKDLPFGWEKHEGNLTKYHTFRNVIILTQESLSAIVNSLLFSFFLSLPLSYAHSLNMRRTTHTHNTDNDGPYYWHIKSGTIQREPPIWPKSTQQDKILKTPVACLNQSPSFMTQPTRSYRIQVSCLLLRK